MQWHLPHLATNWPSTTETRSNLCFPDTQQQSSRSLRLVKTHCLRVFAAIYPGILIACWLCEIICYLAHGRPFRPAFSISLILFPSYYSDMIPLKSKHNAECGLLQALSASSAMLKWAQPPQFFSQLTCRGLSCVQVSSLRVRDIFLWTSFKATYCLTGDMDSS